MTVFIVHPVRDDLSPALKFGDFRFINHRYINGDELQKITVPQQPIVANFNLTPRIPPEIVEDGYAWGIPVSFDRNMRNAALDFMPATDYLLIAGDHLQLLAMTGILFSWHSSFSVLRYDRRISEYIPVRLYSGLRDDTTRVRVQPHIGVDIEQETDQMLARVRNLESPLAGQPRGPGYHPPKIVD